MNTGIRTLLFFCLSTSSLCHAEEIIVGQKFRLHSDVLSEERAYWVSVPRSHRSDGYKKYPVLYILDANENSFFHAFTGMVKQMGAGASPTIPELIVVGIVSQRRVRDSSPSRSLVQYGGKESDSLSETGGADNFLKFLKEELVPHIDGTFSTSDYRVLVGYSFTGLAVIQALYTIPRTFNAYIAIDPSMWWDEQVLLKRVDDFLDDAKLQKSRLFISTSHRVPSIYPKENFVIQFIDKMKSSAVAGLTFGSKVYGFEENHQSMPVISFYQGLRFTFDRYMIDEGMGYRSAVELKAHYKKVSAELGGDFLPSESLVDFFADNRMYNDQFGIDTERAIEFYQLNVEYYPRSYRAWESLGDGFLADGDNPLARDAYRKSLELNPNNKNAKRKMDKIESDSNF